MQSSELKQLKLNMLFKKVIIRKGHQILPIPNNLRQFNKDIRLQTKFPKHHRENPFNKHRKMGQKPIIMLASKRQVGRSRANQDTQAKLIEKYQNMFKWLLVDEGNYFCDYCKKYVEYHKVVPFNRKNDNTLIFIGSSCLKKDIFVKHSKRSIRTWRE